MAQLNRVFDYVQPTRVNGYIVYLNVDSGRRGHVNPLSVFVTDYTVTPNDPEFVVMFHNNRGSGSRSFKVEQDAVDFANSLSPEKGFDYPIHDAWTDPHWVD